MRPVSYYSIVFLEDPLRGERLNVGIVGWCDTDDTLHWVFLDDLTFLHALRIPTAAIEAFTNLFGQLQLLPKDKVMELMATPRGPYSWLGYTKKCASFLPSDVLVGDMFRMLLAREAVAVNETPESVSPDLQRTDV